jgi:hypothetical protein
MTATRRWQVTGWVAVAIVATALLGVPTTLARQATPVASPVATPPGHPAHIHAGTCDALGDVAIPLNDVTGSGGPPTEAIEVEWSVTRVDATLETIMATPHAINVHESADDIGTSIACGTIAGQVSGADLFLGLGELGGSGYSGIAWLHDNADGSTTVSVFLSEGLSNAATPEPNATQMASPTA